MSRPPNYSLSTCELIFQYLPDYCWQTSFEILTMIEQIYEDISPNTLYVTLHHMRTNNLVDARMPIRLSPKGAGPNPKWEYKLINP